MSVPRARRTPRTPAQRRRENLDIFLGILGFFTIAVFVSTASAELHGRPSLGRAVALAVLVVLVFLTVRVRRGLQPATGPDRSERGADVRGPGDQS